MNYTMELTFGIGVRLRDCEKTVCALIYLKVFPLWYSCGLTLFERIPAVVINVFIFVAFSSLVFCLRNAYHIHVGGFLGPFFFNHKQVKISANKEQWFLLVLRSSES